MGCGHRQICIVAPQPGRAQGRGLATGADGTGDSRPSRGRVGPFPSPSAAALPRGRLALGRDRRRRPPAVATEPRRLRKSSRAPVGSRLCPPGSPLDERRQRRELVGEVEEHRLEVPLEGARGPPARRVLAVPRLAPRGELGLHGLLEGLPVGQVRDPAPARAHEVALVEGERRGEARRLDEAADEAGRRGRQADPVPPAADHLAEGADREALQVLGERRRDPLEDGRRRPASSCAAGARRASRLLAPTRPSRRRAMARPFTEKRDARRVALGQDRVEGRVEERLVVQAQAALDVARVEEGRQRVAELQADGGAARAHPPRGRDPLPRRLLARGEVPAGGHVDAPAARLGEHGLRHQQAELDPHAGEADALAAGLGAGREIVVAGQLAPAHAAAVVHHHDRLLRGVGEDVDARRARVERVRHDLREDRLLDGVRVGVAQVLEQVLEVDARLAHRGWSIPLLSAPTAGIGSGRRRSP